MSWYFVITEEMRTSLGLKGNELLVFAIINGYSQSQQGCFYGSLAYLQELTGAASKRTIITTLQDLVAKGHIVKREMMVDGVRRVLYTVADGWCKKCTGGSAEIAPGGSANFAPNNKGIDIKNIKDNIYTDRDFLAGLIALGVTPETADAWMVVRHKAKAVSTRVAFDGIAREVAKSGLPAEDCIRTAVERSWRGFKAEWLRRDTPQPLTPSPRQESLVEHNRRVLEEVLNGIKRSNN